MSIVSCLVLGSSIETCGRLWRIWNWSMTTANKQGRVAWSRSEATQLNYSVQVL